MKYFDLSLPTPGEQNPKTHKVDNDAFKKALVVVARATAERMIELGFGKWISVTSSGNVAVPHAFYEPEALLFVNTPTGSVKVCHVNALVEGLGPIPNDYEAFCESVVVNARFSHTKEDLVDPEFLEEDDLFELMEEDGQFEPATEVVKVEVEVEIDKPEKVKPTPGSPIDKVKEALKAEKKEKEATALEEEPPTEK